jgi:1-phosphofructokinase
MIVTVTPNPAVDRILVIPGFRTGSTNRAVVERTDIGGKGINVARHLTRLGCEVIATGFLGARDLRGVVETLAAQRVRTDFVRVAGETRVNLKILDPTSGQETEINEPGPPLAPDAVDALLDKVRALAPRCAVMVFSGSLPPGAPDDLYARAITLAAGAGVRTVLDATGAPLRQGIAARPDLVKPNRAEAEELLGVSLRDEADVIAAAKRLVEDGARTAVISLGPAGAVCASTTGAWRARAPQITPQNTVGSGDAMVAALAWALMRSLSAPDALRFATALGSAVAASDAPLPPPGLLEALLPEVLIEAAAPGEAPYGTVRIGS